MGKKVVLYKNAKNGKLKVESVDKLQPDSVYLNRFPGSIIFNTSDFPSNFNSSWKLNPTPFENVNLATTGPLPDSPTYSSGILTSTGDPGNLMIDGIEVSLGMRVLVKDQVNNTQNGIYEASEYDGSNWVLIRAYDFVEIMTPLFPSSSITVSEGTINGGSIFIIDNQINTIDTDAVTFSPGTVPETYSILVDITSAKENHKDALRQERKSLFEELDKLFIEAQSKGKSLDLIRARQNYLRDITEDPAFDSATSITDLENITIDEWTPPVIDDLPPEILPGDTVTKNEQIISTAGNETYAHSQMHNGLIMRDCNGENRIDVTDTAANIIANFDGANVGSSYEFVVRNVSSDYNVITVSPGAGCMVVGSNTIAPNASKKFLVLVTNISPGFEEVKIHSLNTIDRIILSGNFINAFQSNDRYLQWNNSTGYQGSLVNNIWLARSCKITEMTASYHYNAPIEGTPGTIIHYDIGRVRMDGPRPGDPTQDNFESLLDSAIVWNIDNVTGTYPVSTSGPIDILVEQNTRLAIRVREIGSVTQSKADINVVVLLELD